jgi:multidrug efflux system membrane fusion protein
MNSKIWVALVLLCGLLAGCGKKGEEAKDNKDAKDGKDAKESAEKAAEPESRVKHGTNGEVIVTVEAKMQPLIGLRVSPLQVANLSPELKAYGRVLDPSSLAASVADLVTAEAAGKTSQAELNRLKTLAAQSNASERAVQNAQAAAIHDQAQIQAIRLKLMAAWGQAISLRTDLPEFIQNLGSLASALVELRVPASQGAALSPTAARLLTLGDETNTIPAELLGPAPNVDPQMQGRGFLFLVSPNPQRLAPGAAVTGLLTLPGEPRRGSLLPHEAVVWFNGAPWTYLQTSEETFQRVQVILGSPLDGGWFVPRGLKPQDKVVTSGGQQLLSEELKGQLGGD